MELEAAICAFPVVVYVLPLVKRPVAAAATGGQDQFIGNEEELSHKLDSHFPG